MQQELAAEPLWYRPRLTGVPEVSAPVLALS